MLSGAYFIEGQPGTLNNEASSNYRIQKYIWEFLTNVTCKYFYRINKKDFNNVLKVVFHYVDIVVDNIYFM